MICELIHMVTNASVKCVAMIKKIQFLSKRFRALSLDRESSFSRN